MSGIAEARRLALALPETIEADHHRIASFRVCGKIFATLPDDEHIRIMVDEAEIRAAVAEHPTVCAELYWGKRLACAVATLTQASPGLLRELLTEAWLRKAPKTLARTFTHHHKQ